MKKESAIQNNKEGLEFVYNTIYANILNTPQNRLKFFIWLYNFHSKTRYIKVRKFYFIFKYLVIYLQTIFLAYFYLCIGVSC